MGIENSYLTEWNCYLSIRLIVGLLDFVTDVLHAGWLFYSQHALWGGLVVSLPFLGVLVAAISVMLSRRSNFANLSFSKFIIVSAHYCVHFPLDKKCQYWFYIYINIFSNVEKRTLQAIRVDVHLPLDWQFHAPLNGFHPHWWILYPRMNRFY